MKTEIKPIVITMGEPSGIGGELTVKAWRAREEQGLAPFFVLGDPDWLRAADADVPLQEIQSASEAVEVFEKAIPVLPIKLAAPLIVGMLNPLNGANVLESISRAVKLCMEGEASAVVTNPIHKAVLMGAGFEHAGHTEYLAELCGKNETPIMMLAAKELRVVPLTVHIALADVPRAITQELIIERVRIVSESMKRDFKIASPRIAVAGLNPHAGEDGKLGLEDQEVITPALHVLKSEGINVMGPHPADTLFHAEARTNYDVALGMYHDQALIPLKTLDFHGGVNITLGLSIVRTSPDHGTALDIAGKNIANPQSFINAIREAAEISKNRS